jgi:type IV pilus assembly protein PilY1
LGTFTDVASTQRTDWYNGVYNMTTSGSTPLRSALTNAGRYFAGKIGTDPLQYSCQQNFTILSTDGYWNSGDGFKLDGSTIMDQQDGTAGRPMNDGAQAGTTVVTTYTRNTYSKITGSCGGGKKQLKTQPE